MANAWQASCTKIEMLLAYKKESILAQTACKNAEKNDDILIMITTKYKSKIDRN